MWGMRIQSRENPRFLMRMVGISVRKGTNRKTKAVGKDEIG